jgi:hypothetical protein
MAMKKDDDKSKKTLSGKKPATFGGANSKLMPPKPKAQSSVMVKPPRPMGRNVTGERNWDKSSSSRVMVSAGPYEISKGGKTAKSTGGMNMTGGKVIPKKSSPTAKVSGSGINDPNSTGGYQSVSAGQQQAAQQKASGKKSGRIGAGLITLFGGLGAAYTLNKNKEERREKRAERKATKAAKKRGVMVVEKGTKTKTK